MSGPDLGFDPTQTRQALRDLQSLLSVDKFWAWEIGSASASATDTAAASTSTSTNGSSSKDNVNNNPNAAANANANTNTDTNCTTINASASATDQCLGMIFARLLVHRYTLDVVHEIAQWSGQKFGWKMPQKQATNKPMVPDQSVDWTAKAISFIMNALPRLVDRKKNSVGQPIGRVIGFAALKRFV